MLIPVGAFRISRFYYSYSFIVPICIGTAVNSICLRTCVSSYPRLCFKAGAKLEILFVSCKKNLKNFETFFSFQFFQFFSQSLSELPVFAGCKCKKHFQISQAFPNLFFENFFSIDPYFLSVFLWTFSLLRVQKYTTIPVTQGFFQTIFILFLFFFLTLS
jgi:hypothetical protein